ncbi:MAG TPA: hypothetical protein DDZ88_14820 [Verrucomicrobiales bacterium]|nr:hypothetical protein [Verrucomicrobiales bacterium]
MMGDQTSGRRADAYARQMRQLLPRGPAWNFAEDGPFARLLLALGEEFARIDARAGDLIDEADPRTTLELLDDWERVAGLPDSCTGVPEDIHERQAVLHQKITGLGGQNAAAFIEVAARLGYQVEIAEHRAAQVNMRCGDRANGEVWAFAWTVHVRPFEGYLTASEFLAYAKAGDPVGVRIRGFGAVDVECVIRRAAPAPPHAHRAVAHQGGTRQARPDQGGAVRTASGGRAGRAGCDRGTDRRILYRRRPGRRDPAQGTGCRLTSEPISARYGART